MILPGYGTLLRHTKSAQFVKERAAELLVTLHILQCFGLVSSVFSTEFYLILVPSCLLHRTLYRGLGWCQVVFQCFFSRFHVLGHRIQPRESMVVSDFELTS